MKVQVRVAVYVHDVKFPEAPYYGASPFIDNQKPTHMAAAK